MRVSLASPLLLLLLLAHGTQAFVPTTSCKSCSTNLLLRRLQSTTSSSSSTSSRVLQEPQSQHQTDQEEDLDIDFLFDVPLEEETRKVQQQQQQQQQPVLEDLHEQVWRYANKPLLRIGSKGATHAHGNSLRQLLEDHTLVKVKVNLKKYGTLQKACDVLQLLATENGAPANLQVLEMREATKEILFAQPGTLQRIQAGLYPPRPSFAAASSLQRRQNHHNGTRVLMAP